MDMAKLMPIPLFGCCRLPVPSKPKTSFHNPSAVVIMGLPGAYNSTLQLIGTWELQPAAHGMTMCVAGQIGGCVGMHVDLRCDFF